MRPYIIGKLFHIAFMVIIMYCMLTIGSIVPGVFRAMNYLPVTPPDMVIDGYSFYIVDDCTYFSSTDCHGLAIPNLQELSYRPIFIQNLSLEEYKYYTNDQRYESYVEICNHEVCHYLNPWIRPDNFTEHRICYQFGYVNRTDTCKQFMLEIEKIGMLNVSDDIYQQPTVTITTQ